jgi:hypothetical protein
VTVSPTDGASASGTRSRAIASSSRVVDSAHARGAFGGEAQEALGSAEAGCPKEMHQIGLTHQYILM